MIEKKNLFKKKTNLKKILKFLFFLILIKNLMNLFIKRRTNSLASLVAFSFVGLYLSLSPPILSCVEEQHDMDKNTYLMSLIVECYSLFALWLLFYFYYYSQVALLALLLISFCFHWIRLKLDYSVKKVFGTLVASEVFIVDYHQFCLEVHQLLLYSLRFMIKQKVF